MSDNRSRLYITLALITMVIIMFCGVTVIALIKPEAVATIVAFVGSTLTTTITAVFILNKLNKVERQTNGINTALLASTTGMSKDEIDSHKGIANAKSD